MNDPLAVVKDTLDRTRARWRRLATLTALGRWASAVALVTFLALLAYWLVLPSDGWLLTLAVIASAASLALLVPAVRAWWNAPTDKQVARFVEERCPELEDRLASAAECLETKLKLGPTTEAPANVGPSVPPADVGPSFSLVYTEHVVADAARRLEHVDLDRVLHPRALRKAAALAGAAIAGLLLVGYVGRAPAARAVDLASLYAFPGRLRIDVTPGDVRLQAGKPLLVTARVSGAAPVTPNLVVVNGSARRTLAMHATPGPEGFTIALEGVTADFTYSVEAGSARSSVFGVTVVHPPRVKRIDLRYEYPKAFGLEPRTEESGGDIYGPSGTKVQIDVHADKPLTNAALVLADGTRVPLATVADANARTQIELTEDTSYRVALSDRDGLSSQGDTEYFVRLLSDRPPDVRIVQPAADTQVTALEEVAIDARADDDHGIDRFELVYAVRGGKEKVVPFPVDRSQPAAEGRQTLFMEELGVKPGDFVSYYARARDVSRGKRSTEARSDIFFLEVKGFEEEFTLAQSQAMGGGGGGSPFDDLAAAQKEIIIATWKLDRRALDGQSGRSAEDIKAVAAAQGQLRVKTEQAAAAQAGQAAASRRRLRPGQEPAGDNPLGLAVQAMTRAEATLGRIDTKGALPHEMDALNQLLKAQAEVRRFQISRQQAAGGGGGYGRQGQDLSALFDRELQRQQQTNYENPTTTEQRPDPDRNDALDKIRELARRQDELAKKQQELAQKKAELSEEELKRQLERLTREQSELRRQAEELSQQMARQQGRGQGQGQGRGQSQGQAQTQSQGQSAGMREISEEMRQAANDLRREDLDRASARGGRAGEMLREMERQIGERQPNDRARQLGDVQLEARQLADAQQRVAAEASRMTKGTSADEMRRLAGEKDRIADRTQALADAVKRAASGALQQGREGAQPGYSPALADALKQMDARQLERQMRESAERLRSQAQMTEADARREQQLRQDYERLADRLSAASGRADGDRLADSMAKTQELRQRFEQLSREQDRLREQAGRAGGQRQGEQSASRGEQPSRGDQAGRAGRGSREGRDGRGAGAGGGSGTDAAKIREEQQRQLQQAQELMNELRQLNPGAAGSTPEGQQMVTSAPGTEAFKQDFSKWEQLRKAIESALERTEQQFAQTLRERLAKDRLNAGIGDHTPEPYRKMVERYYKSLAERKR